MYRTINKTLLQWKSKPQRKPLVLLGARQVGKTYALKELGLQAFKNTVYLNFEANENLKTIFDLDLDAVRIVRDLRMSGHSIVEGETLIIFDEIQQCGRALTSLKYFCEKLPNLHVSAAGSLLGLFLAETSFPVGKVEFQNMYPLTFLEFLYAVGAHEIITHLERFCTREERLSAHQHQLLFAYLKEYLVTGGLPEVVFHFAQQRHELEAAFAAARHLQSQLFINYVADIAKHSGKLNSMHIERLWQNSANQLAKTEDSGAEKFKFKGVIPNIRGYERLAGVIDWLVKAGLSLKVPICNKSAHPLKAFTKESIFKLYVFDVGILGAMTGLQPASIFSYDFGSYKGFIAENFVLQELHANGESPVCWTEGVAEIEFLWESGSQIIPLEVKAGLQTKSKRMKAYREKYAPELAIKISGNHIESLAAQNGVLNLPIYAAGIFCEGESL